MRIRHEAETTINLTYSNKTFPAMQGSTAYFDCGWSFDESKQFPTELIFSSTRKGVIYRYFIGNRFQTETFRGLGFDAARRKTSSVGPDVVSVVLTLSDLERIDEGFYTVPSVIT